jgi:hypothetical protein
VPTGAAELHLAIGAAGSRHIRPSRRSSGWRRFWSVSSSRTCWRRCIISSAPQDGHLVPKGDVLKFERSPATEPKESRETSAERMIIMPMTVWRRHCNRYAFSAFRSFEQPQVFTHAVQSIADPDLLPSSSLSGRFSVMVRMPYLICS